MMSMTLRFPLHIAAVALMAIGLAGCGKSYRYKLTVAINTPAGVKRASSIGEVQFWSVLIPARGVGHKLRGQALYLDLGKGAKPLIALLTNRLHSNYGWTRDAGPGTQQMCSLYGLVPSADLIDTVANIARQRGPRKITPDQLPDLVTFADVNNPNTVIEINPNDLQGTLGPGVSWNEITLEATDEPVTTGIKSKLPWLPSYRDRMLDGDRTYHKRTLANTLSTADFDQSDN